VAGLAFSLSLLTKSLLFLWFPLLLALLAMPHRGEEHWQIKEIGKTWLVFGLSAALPWLAVCLWVDPLAMVQQNYVYHLAARPAYPVNTPAHNLGLMALYLRDVFPWLPIAGYGALRAIWWPRPLAWVPLVMFLLTVLWLVVQGPLHIHALVALLPPLALLATQGVKETVSSVRQWPSAHIGGWIALLLGIAALLSGLLGLSLWKWPRPVLATVIPDDPPREAIRLLQQAVPTYGRVITDNPKLVYYAGRRAHPWLSDPSIMRMKSGSVSSADLITFTEAAGDEIVVATTRFPPPYRDWLGQHYWVDWTQDGLQHLYVGRRRPLSKEGSPAAIFAEGIVLDRAHVVRSQGVADEWLEVEMVWHSRRCLTTDYTIFIHLLDAQGQLAAQTDRPPLLNLMPTSHWPVEEGIGDRFFLQLPEGSSSGQYRLILGLYHSDTIERLPVVASPNRSLGDAVVIGEVDVNCNCK
jgi:hypothetical protein